MNILGITGSKARSELPAKKRVNKKNDVRRQITSIHRWTGLTFGWLLLITAITGAMMAFRPQLETRIHPYFHSSTCANQLTGDQLLALARAAKPDFKALHIRMFGEAGWAARVRFSDDNMMFLDPCTGAVLGEENRYAGLFGSIEKIHTYHYGDWSSKIAGTDALIFALILGSAGIYMSLPALRSGWKRVLRIDPRWKGRARYYGQHRAVALYAVPILLVSAVTGVPQALPWAKHAIYGAAMSPMPERPKVVPRDTPIVSMESVFHKARAMNPKAREITIFFPKTKKNAMEVVIIAKDAPHNNARTTLFVNPYSGQVISYEPYAKTSLGSKIYYWTLAIHSGDLYGSLVWRAVLMLAALTVPFLAYTGLRSYLGGRKKRRAPGGQSTKTPQVSG